MKEDAAVETDEQAIVDMLYRKLENKEPGNYVFTNSKTTILYGILRDVLWNNGKEFEKTNSSQKRSALLQRNFGHVSSKIVEKYNYSHLEVDLYYLQSEIVAQIERLIYYTFNEVTGRKLFKFFTSNHFDVNTHAKFKAMPTHEKLVGMKNGFLQIVNVEDDNFHCTCNRCKTAISLSKKEFEVKFACGRCDIHPEFDLKTAKEVTAERLEAKIAEVTKEARKYAYRNYLPALRSEKYFKAAQGNKSVISTILEREYVKDTYLFGMNADLEMWAGLPIDPNMDLHRIGHEQDGKGEYTPYGPLTVMWLPEKENEALHKDNIGLWLDGRRYPSMSEACDAAGLVYDTVRKALQRVVDKLPEDASDEEKDKARQAKFNDCVEKHRKKLSQKAKNNGTTEEKAA